ncbi:MAG: Trk system potassium transporter TrkA [Firmicutes bacterium HGW-Firmicutes-14]|nr:MAG: Trk system potassium transporter TrkA [Firmicutes bacterium HGW-Firmicutes-14]
MHAIIIGTGKVGFSIAQMLSLEGHEVTVIEKDEERRRIVQESLDVQTLLGSGASPVVLEEAGVTSTDLVVAVTEMDELNIVSCMIAKQYGVAKTVARVRNPEYVETTHKSSQFSLGVDVIINPERVTANEIVKLMEVPEALKVEYYADGQVQLLELRLTPASPVIGTKLKDLGLSHHALIVAIQRQGSMIIPRGDDVLETNDVVFVVARTDEMIKVEKLLGQKRVSIQKVTILGGGRIGYYLARLLEEKRLQVKIIEKDKQKCKLISDRLYNSLVINGDGTDIELLKEEGTGEADLFVAATGDDKLNLLVSLLSKHLGVKNTTTVIRRSEYISLVEQVGIDVVVSPRILTASTILKLILPQEVVSVSFLGGANAETMEIIVPEKCKANYKKLKDIRFPRGAIIGSIMRGDSVIVPTGEDQILPLDRVMIFALPDAVTRVNNFFEVGRRGI